MSPAMIPQIARVSTPLNIKRWEQYLKKHPDRDYAGYILQGLQHGFSIGLDSSMSFNSAKRNMPSANENPKVIDEYIQEETDKGNILGPFSLLSPSGYHVNRIGVIPKRHQPGKWRLITDLSFPEGASVNDAIDPTKCSLTYISVDDVANRAILLGKGSLIAKIDIKAAYRLVPVWPPHRQWLGMKWKDKIYLDGMLPFGLRSAPKIFNAVADALEWCVSSRGVANIFHYLDDFAVVGPPDTESCHQDLMILKQVCTELGVPLAPDKQEGPSTTIVFLGIVIDTVKQELRLPEEKLGRLQASLIEWEKRISCTRKELESFIGVLQHACRMIKPGRSFLRQAIALLSVTKHHYHYVRLNAEFRADLMWWRTFAAHWNGCSLIIHKNCQLHKVTSDASGSWGCGAWHNEKWFQLAWDSSTQELHITAKEMIPIIIALVIWGAEWTKGRVIAQCDNEAVVTIINSRYSSDKYLMQMLRCLFLLKPGISVRLKLFIYQANQMN